MPHGPRRMDYKIRQRFTIFHLEQKTFNVRKKIEESSKRLLSFSTTQPAISTPVLPTTLDQRFQSDFGAIVRSSIVGVPLSVSVPRSMAVLVKRFGSSDVNEQFGSVEQEPFIKDSSELRNELVTGGGFEAIVNRLSKWVVSALLASIILLRHDGTALWVIIGTASNWALGLVLKRILNQARPGTTFRTDPGMPSSHAQSISFISVFAVLSVTELLGTSKVSLFLSGLILAVGSYFIRLRVSQKLHTSSQVVVGAIVGSVFCILWYTTWNSLLLQVFESSLLFQISVFLVAAALALVFAAYVVKLVLKLVQRRQR